jgi:putative PIN family toxin of toxin-antitoxin system
MRVVLDTNILISALWKPDGLEAQTVSLVREGNIVAYVSTELWDEYREVLYREKFHRLSESAEKLLAALCPRVIRVVPSEKVAWSVDEGDNRILECAGEAQADYLITGNLRHFPVVWKDTRIINARAFLGQVSSRFSI